MAYTRPAANAANLTWSGTSVFARPVATAANLVFAPAYQVSGWNAANFGAPSVKEHAVTGFAPVHFGSSITIEESYVSGFAPVNFGQPTARGVYQVAGFSPVTFGGDITLATNVQGFAPARFGIPGLAINVASTRPVAFGTPAATEVNHVSAWRAAVLGTPTVPTNRTVAVVGTRLCHFGTPVSVRLRLRRFHWVGNVYRLRGTRFGNPSV